MLRKTKSFSIDRKGIDGESLSSEGLQRQEVEQPKSSTEADPLATLEKSVFGGDHHVIDNLGDQIEEKLIDKEKTAEKRKAAWEDPNEKDDVSVPEGDFRYKRTRRKGETKVTAEVYQSRLKDQVLKTFGTGGWADLSSDKDREVEGDDALSRGVNGYLHTHTSSLPRQTLRVTKLVDVNRQAYTRGQVNALEFHPTSQVALVAGGDKTLNIFQVDGKTNAKIQSICLDGFPIYSAHFSANGEEVIMGSKHKSFYYYDMLGGRVREVPPVQALERAAMGHLKVSPCGKFIVFRGKYGYIHVLSAKSKELITQLKINGSVESMCFNNDGSKLFAFGDSAEVYVFDMSTRQCCHKFVDEGCIRGTSLASCPNNRFIACGSHSGIVNIYDSHVAMAKSCPPPLKTVMNLITPCTHLTFNSSSEILAMTSSHADNALKMVHMSSLTTFSNFPSKALPVGTPSRVAFSLSSGYVALGTVKGHAKLYRLEHYGQY